MHTWSLGSAAWAVALKYITGKSLKKNSREPKTHPNSTFLKSHKYIHGFGLIKVPTHVPNFQSAEKSIGVNSSGLLIQKKNDETS